jgi:hypothetical protein
MMTCVRSGAFANLEELYIRELWCRALNLGALEVLIKHCPLLKIIEILTYPHLNTDVIQELKRLILAQNLDLQIKELHK